MSPETLGPTGYMASEYVRWSASLERSILVGRERWGVSGTDRRCENRRSVKKGSDEGNTET